MRRLSILVACLAVLGALVTPLRASASSAELLPDGEVRPVIVAASLHAPARHNRLLEADLDVTALDDGEIRRYEYRWNRATFGAVRGTNIAHPTVSYASTLPGTRYALEVRAVDDHGWASDWFSVWSGVTPRPPRLVVAGDSVASGYHRRWFTGRATCQDRSEAYGRFARDRLAELLPDAWNPVYVNVAWPGAGLAAMLDGGEDSCPRTHPAEVAEILDAVDPGTWNVVVVTAGIDSTNWVDVVKSLVWDTAVSIDDDGDRAACEAAVERRWNLPSRQDELARKVAEVVGRLSDGTTAALYWTGYYSIEGTRLAPGWMPVGAECDAAMTRALDELHATLQAGIGTEATWIDLTGVDVSTQGWAGWPHPDEDGHRAIGRAVAEAIAAGA